MKPLIFSDTSDFPTLREENAVYVDKTALIYQMLKFNRAVFLSRPRRFGKSLLVTTLEAYFQGRKELFAGLAIEKLEQDWKKYPVLHFDMSGRRYKNSERLDKRLDVMLSQYEEIYGREDYATDANSRLNSLIRRAKEQTGQNVVILVDEYDAPLLDVMTDSDAFEDLRDILRDFYSPLKESLEHLRFVFITGITRFSQLSIFSEINNLNSISMDDEYASLCGITEEEIRNSLKPEVMALAQKHGLDFEEAMAALKQKYDGYHFSKISPDIYNPFSLMKCLQKKELDNYWFASATPTHLTEMISEYSLRPEELDGFYADIDDFDVGIENADSPLPMFYQSGYVTIKDYDNGEYLLGFPNEEVRYGFLKGLMPYYTKLGSREISVFVRGLSRAMRERDIERAMQLMRSFLSSIPYNAQRQDEDYYKSLFYLTFILATAYNVRTEVCSAAGRCDVVVETKDAVCVFEFKLNGSSEEALKQIEEKGYAIPYENGSKKLYKIGACFDKELRTLKDWIIVEV